MVRNIGQCFSSQPQNHVPDEEGRFGEEQIEISHLMGQTRKHFQKQFHIFEILTMAVIGT